MWYFCIWFQCVWPLCTIAMHGLGIIAGYPCVWYVHLMCVCVQLIRVCFSKLIVPCCAAQGWSTRVLIHIKHWKKKEESSRAAWLLCTKLNINLPVSLSGFNQKPNRTSVWCRRREESNSLFRCQNKEVLSHGRKEIKAANRSVFNKQNVYPWAE